MGRCGLLVSLALFMTRGLWMMATPERLQQRWVKVAPHVVDTVLLASAIVLVWELGGLDTIRTQSWLAAKIVGLLAYIHRAGEHSAQAWQYPQDSCCGFLCRDRSVRLHRLGRDRKAPFGLRKLALAKVLANR